MMMAKQVNCRGKEVLMDIDAHSRRMCSITGQICQHREELDRECPCGGYHWSKENITDDEDSKVDGGKRFATAAPVSPPPAAEEEFRVGDRFETPNIDRMTLIQHQSRCSMEEAWWRVRWDKPDVEGIVDVSDLRKWTRLPRGDAAVAKPARIPYGGTLSFAAVLPSSKQIAADLAAALTPKPKPAALAHDFSDPYCVAVLAASAFGPKLTVKCCRVCGERPNSSERCAPQPGWRLAYERQVSGAMQDIAAECAPAAYDPKTDTRDPWAALRRVVPMPSRREPSR